MCWKLIKGWLDPRTAEKIVFCSKAEMKKYIDEENLPKVKSVVLFLRILGIWRERIRVYLPKDICLGRQ